MGVYSAIRFDSLPEQLPVQVQIDGSIRMMPREQAVWVMPIVTALIWLSMAATPYIDKRPNLQKRVRRFYTLNQMSSTLLLFSIHIAMLTYYDDPLLIARLVIIGALVVFIVIGNEMPRLPVEALRDRKPHWLARWSKTSRRTNRFAGRALVLVGLTVLPAALMLPLGTVMLVMLVTLTLSSIGIMLYSYMDAQQART